MNWRQLLDRLPLRIVKNLNIAATEEAQRCYDTYRFRCYNCEKYLTVEADSWWGAQDIRIISNWEVVEENIPGVIKLYYFCPPCADWRK